MGVGVRVGGEGALFRCSHDYEGSEGSVRRSKRSQGGVTGIAT